MFFLFFCTFQPINYKSCTLHVTGDNFRKCTITFSADFSISQTAGGSRPCLHDVKINFKRPEKCLLRSVIFHSEYIFLYLWSCSASMRCRSVSSRCIERRWDAPTLKILQSAAEKKKPRVLLRRDLRESDLEGEKNE